MLEKRQAPPNLHFQSLNPHIDLEDVLERYQVFEMFPLFLLPENISYSHWTFPFGRFWELK